MSQYVVPLGFATFISYRFMTSKVFDGNAEVYEPPLTSIVMCSLNEEFFIEKALESIATQNVINCFPDNFEFILVDSHSEDRTVAIAKDYGWTVYQAPKGKLNARHLGMEQAKGDIIVSVDCDSFYGKNWLNLILRHFSDIDIVGVSAPRLIMTGEGIGWTALSMWMSLIDLGPVGGMRMPGQNSAFRTQAYYDVGGFDLSIDQKNMHAMVVEEEIKFALKLRRIGRVRVDFLAPCFTSMRRIPIKKGERYKKFSRERLAGQRF